ncbi:alpha/beta hydrolase [Pseudoprimorskyibacter insulae]|uniref:2-succinyl-6-hydroxy-2, 4-cyclohexadiene-1-carboxylate synthase n=1 Tax=Pseudoprimorskyibacter insulae TaxID=1695997 RepID=A0A2R8AWB3_9RHOB|nr:alpha/beta fold hydrolase [Pseudoprimorskyibacter insulae]SPF80159.1 2-succinyl-6-hydroxy-2, 4-cyclohexadiene-1-carboxylate synthase [Pseudoprimorskyibacter insulae]
MGIGGAAIGLALGGLATLAVALGLIASQSVPEADGAGGLEFSGLIGRDVTPLPQRAVAMRDGWGMPVHEAKGPADGPLIVAVHGSGWNGRQFDALGAALSDRASVLAVDLRGHGASPDRRGDVDYIGQLEDDLADLIAAERVPGQAVYLLGHSSGGGLVVRMAGGAHRDAFDGAILLAPFLGHRAPTQRKNSGGWAQPMLRRIIGLSILNAVKIRALNHLPVIWFRFPKAVLEGPMGHLATRSYSYRLNVSYAPRSDFKSDIKALPGFLLVAGAQDEAFDAAGYQPFVEGLTQGGSYAVIEGVKHLDVVDHPMTLAKIKEWLDAR